MFKYNSYFQPIMEQINVNQLSSIERRIIKEAEVVMETAYNPYSGFYVGAALYSSDGAIITGSNVENMAYGSTICAERAAILRANAQGIRTYSLIGIIGRGKDADAVDVVSPCGSCRQMIYESSQIAGQPISVLMSDTKKEKIIRATIDELLPLGMGPRDVGIDITRYE